MHAIARLVFHPLIPNVQASWVKLGADGVTHTLCAGANDLGGTLMDESITRAAGGQNGPFYDPARMAELASGEGRPARSEERRVGKECVSPCRSGWWPCQ